MFFLPVADIEPSYVLATMADEIKLIPGIEEHGVNPSHSASMIIEEYARFRGKEFDFAIDSTTITKRQLIDLCYELFNTVEIALCLPSPEIF